MLKGRVNIGNKETTDNFYWMSQKKSFERLEFWTKLAKTVQTVQDNRDGQKWSKNLVYIGITLTISASFWGILHVPELIKLQIQPGTICRRHTSTKRTRGWRTTRGRKGSPSRRSLGWCSPSSASTTS